MFSIYSICIWKKLPAPFLISFPMKHHAQIIYCACLVTVNLKILSLQSEHIIRTLKSVTSRIFYPLLLCRTCCLEDFVIAMYRDLLIWANFPFILHTKIYFFFYFTYPFLQTPTSVYLFYTYIQLNIHSFTIFYYFLTHYTSLSQTQHYQKILKY